MHRISGCLKVHGVKYGRLSGILTGGHIGQSPIRCQHHWRRIAECGQPLIVRDSTVTHTFPMYDKKEQFQDIEKVLIQGEKIYAVFDVKDDSNWTRCLGITNLRVIVHDWQPRDKILSIPYSRIHTVAAGDERGLFTGGTSHIVMNTSGGKYQFEFPGTGKGKIAHDLILGFLVRRPHKRHRARRP